LKTSLYHISKLQSGLFAQPDINADTLYLQGIHFNEYGDFDQEVKPLIKSSDKTDKHLLYKGDVLFAAKSLNNFAVVYDAHIGKAVASSSFIVVRVKSEYANEVLPEYLAWYLTQDPQIRLFHKQLGTTIPSISISKLNELEIDIPTLEQQSRIVQIQKLRNQEKQLLQKLEVNKDQLIKHQLLVAAKQ
jgi:restriction endonuclease S subunit